MKSGCCTICLEPLFKDIQVSSQCGHVFHRACIYRWIDENNTCPNCKQHCDASQLTNLFLDPLEIIKEVLNDPTVLQNVDSDLLLQIYRNDAAPSSPDHEDDIDLEILDLKHKPKPKPNPRMELIEERIQNSALTSKNEELSSQLTAATASLREMQDEKSQLHKKIQSILKSAQSYERKYFDLEEKVEKLNIEIFKKNKELIGKRKEIDALIRKQLQHEHQENIMIGNMNAVHQMEIKVSESGKSKEEQAVYFKQMYDWILKEYRRSQSDRERDKKSHQTQQKKWSEIHEEQRSKINQLTQCGVENVNKYTNMKKHYFGLKDKYQNMRGKMKHLHKKYTELQEEKKGEMAPERNGVVVDRNDGHKTEHEEEDEVTSVSYDENQENITDDKENVNNKEMVEADDEDDDLQMVAMNINAIDSVFTYPRSSNTGVMRHTVRQRNSTSNSLFSAYHKLKQDGSRNPFSNNINVRNRKRNFSQLTKGDDGRGGTKTFVTDNGNRTKRRRIVQTSNAHHNNKNKKNCLVNYFKRTK